LRGKTVLIGGSWHAYAYGRGPMVDSHSSPVGSIPGVFLHANYAAAILDGRTHPPAPNVFGRSVDAITLILLAVLFALPMGWGRRWLWIGNLTIGLAIVSYVFWQNFGVFLETTIPAVFLLVHALLDEYIKMREELISLRADVRYIRETPAI
jgi:CHASE2 domain-containing sensor protein